MSSTPPSTPPCSHVFSMRIVSLDYYMSAPIPGQDFCDSPCFQGKEVEEVPVIRIYGSTVAGQKTCLHVHRALPYLYIPCSEIETSKEGQQFIYEVSEAIEKGLQGTYGSKRQHVHGCCLVRAKKFYGYHSEEELFLKIYLYRPTDVARAATLLLTGSIFNRTIQPYESHVPFLLQFMVDYNLYGMGLLHSSQVKFRQPLPDKFLPRASLCTLLEDSVMEKLDFVYESSQKGSRIWLSSTVPEAWIWTTTDGAFFNDNNCPARQSICDLEGDSSIDDIANQSGKMYTSFSQSSPDAKMVQSLVPIWEEEVERSGLQEYITSPNLGKPSPEAVLRSLCDGFQYESGLADVFAEAKKKLSCKTSPLKSSPDVGGLLMSPQNQKRSLSGEGHLQISKSISERSSTVVWETERKVLDDETLGLLSWLTSSQAVNDDILENELLSEALLSPQLLSNSSEKAFEKAHLEYEINSQQECQDILDSLKGFEFDDQDEASTSTFGDSFPNVIPQVDGSSDEQENFLQVGKASKFSIRRNIEMASSSSFNGRKTKRSRLSRQLCVQDNSLNADLDPQNSTMTREHLDAPRRSVEVDESRLQMNDMPNTVPDAMVTLISKCSGLQVRDSTKLMASSSEAASLPVNYISESEEHDITKKILSNGFTEMTLNRKPPVILKTDDVSVDLDLPSDAILNVDSVNWSHSRDKRNQFLSLQPFFRSDEVDEAIQNSILPGPYSDIIDGIPLNFQNDGSFSYLLTFAVSPPSRQSVSQWLMGQGKRNLSNLPIDPLASESSDVYHHDIRAIIPDELLQHSVYPDSQESLAKEIESPKTISQDFSGHLDHVPSNFECKLSSGSFCDISQLSGQSAKSKLTPLSQLGFRDPASCGSGQNLTLLSLEILAESRGDLFPDPKFDAINLISIAIQEDNDHKIKSYILIRGNDVKPHARNLDGISDCVSLIFTEERLLFDHLVKIITSYDPDILLGWEVQGGSLGYLSERAVHLGMHLLKRISRTPDFDAKDKVKRYMNNDKLTSETSMESTTVDPVIIEDEWGRTHASGIHVGGRIILNVWRLMRSELRLNLYTVEAVAEEVLRRKIPSIPCSTLNGWFLSGSKRARFRCIEYALERANINLKIMNQHDMINRTSELARVFGIDFFSVLSRGSQFRVESMLLRLLHSQNYLAISPGYQQVASQPAMECLPLVMEPESGFYADPVVVLDFQSLYPSMIIAYNLCYSTCLGKVLPSTGKGLGVSSFSPDPRLLLELKENTLLSPNGVMYVSQKVRKGVLPRLLDEILTTRIMVKKAMKKLTPSQLVLQRIFNARQLALKLIANVTYGYTAAGFSGRMPCAELADSIVQCGRKTLESSISFINSHHKWKARVVYGDTDSMFVLLRGRSREEAFEIGREIASIISLMNPEPVVLKMEKVYHPCFLLTKKRYVGYSYENPSDAKPSFDAKGIETIRRDTCPAVSKMLERSLRLFFEQQDVTQVKQYLQRQWGRILSGRVSLQDFVFAKEVRLGSYSSAATASLPPAAIVAAKAMRVDPRREPRYGERVPYVVVHGEPGARLVDMVVDPLELLEVNSPYRLNDLYYINKQIIPALQRIFGLLGVDLNRWFSETPRMLRPAAAKQLSLMGSGRGPLRNRIDRYYLSKNCTVCGNLVNGPAFLCDQCAARGPAVAAILTGRTSKLERDLCHLSDICLHCGGGDWIVERGVKCTSLACSVFFERRKVQKELLSLSSIATEVGFYPRCASEWF